MRTKNQLWTHIHKSHQHDANMHTRKSQTETQISQMNIKNRYHLENTKRMHENMYQLCACTHTHTHVWLPGNTKAALKNRKKHLCHVYPIFLSFSVIKPLYLKQNFRSSCLLLNDAKMSFVVLCFYLLYWESRRQIKNWVLLCNIQCFWVGHCTIRFI